MSKKEFYDLITYSGCGMHCKGGQHVGVSCPYVVAEIKDLNLMVKIEAFRSMFKNKIAAADILWNIYTNYYIK